MNILAKYFVTLFGVGYIPLAPGTFGSVFAILVWYLFITYLNIYLFYVMLSVIIFLSFKLTQKYLDKEKKEDPSEVIIDEFIGQSLPLFLLLQYNIYEVLLAFCSFRFFDIFKIYPVNKAENIAGAKGVIMDDIIAGIYAIIIVLAYRIILFSNA